MDSNNRLIKRFTIYYAVLAAIIVFAKSVEIGESYHNIFINNIDGRDNTECVTANNPSVACQTLNWALLSGHRGNNTQYVLSEGAHLVSSSIVTFTNLNNLAFLGNGSNVSVNCVDNENVGFAFTSVSGIIFRALTFRKCSMINNGTIAHYGGNLLQKSYQFKAALFFLVSRDVVMETVSVVHSCDAVGVAMVNTAGNNVFINSNFSYNRVKGSSNFLSGGGFYVEFKSCTSSDISCTDNTAPPETTHDIMYNSNSSFTFDNCTFSHNSVSNIDSSYTIPRGSSHQERFGQGGGLSIQFKGDASGNKIKVLGCNFIKNDALWGGGVFTKFQDTSLNNSVVFDGCTVDSNECPDSSDTGGGGMRIEHYIFDSSSSLLTGNQVGVQNCIFTRNSASSGGALSISPSLQHTRSPNELLEVQIANTSFLQNDAQIGGAVHIALLSLIIDGDLPMIGFSDSNFVRNSLAHHLERHNTTVYELGIGVVYTNRVHLLFRNEVLFEENEGSGLAVVAAKADFSNCTATFFKNSGKTGGAIALLGAAFIVVSDFTRMNFTQNHANIHGGAISNTYIERENFAFYPNCFIHHTNPFLHPDEWNAEFYFEDNKASLHGPSIHSTSIFPCARKGGESGVESQENALCCDNWIYVKNGSRTNCLSQISSDSGKINFTEEEIIPVRTFPGQVFHLPLQISDDLDRNSSSTTIFTARTQEMHVARVDPKFRFVSGEYVKVNGQEETNVTLNLDTSGERVWHAEIELELLRCPPGFSLSADDRPGEQHCVCGGDQYDGKLRCSQDSYESSLLNGYWMGTTESNSSELFVSLCLPGFCNKDKKDAFLKIPQSPDELDDAICGQGLNRTGILCGQCIEGYGPAVNSPNFNCIPCNDTNIAAHATYYVLAVYLPLFIMFSALILFSIRLTSGPANAFIFFGQVVSSNFDLNADGHIPLNLITNHTDVLLKSYRALYGVFNLDFLENFLPPLCLGTNLSALDVLQLDYVVALFPLLMVIAVVFAVKIKDCCMRRLKFFRERHTATSDSAPASTRRKRRTWKAGESLLHAFASFILLSYIKFSLTSTYIVNIHLVFDTAGKPADNGIRHAYYAGQYTTNDLEYILRYYIPGIIVLILVAIPPIVLFGYPVIWFEKCLIHIRCLWRLYPADKVHILLDTFQGCYKDNRRFFAGMYFFFRLTINIIYILTDDWLQQFIVQQITCTIFIIIFALCWPYREEYWYLNYVDLLIFMNLSIVNALSLYLYTFSHINSGHPLPVSAFVVQYALVFVPLFYMIGYVIWYFLKPSHKESLKLCLTSPLKQLKVIINKTKAVKISYHRKLSEETLTASYQSLENSVLLTRHSRKSEPTHTEISIANGEQDEITEIEDDMEAIFVRAKAQNTYKAVPEKKPASGGHFNPPTASAKDSGFHTLMDNASGTTSAAAGKR